MKAYFIRTITVMLCVAVILSLCSCGASENAADSSPEKSDSAYTETTGNAVLENESVRFELDCATTHFRISGADGVSLTSVPEFSCDAASEEIKKEFVSELKLTYYDSDGKENHMYSTSDSVEKENFKVLKGNGTVKVIYSFGETNSTLLVPKVLNTEDFERIMSKLSSGQQRRMKLYYTAYSPEDKTPDFEKTAEKYPAVKNTPLYILNDTLSDQNYIDINDYMETAGYTREDYQSSAEKYGITEDSEDTPGFSVPVEYSLTSSGFKADIIFDEVTEKSENYKLTSVTLLPYFAAADSKTNGDYLVPDGSGALFSMNNSKGTSYSRDFFGDDPAISGNTFELLSQNQYLPVFGMYSDIGSYLATVDGAAAAAKLNVSTYSAQMPANSACISFTYRVFDKIQNTQLSAGDGSAEGIYNVYGNVITGEQPSVSYTLMAKNCGYAAMADRYRNYLTASGSIKEKSRGINLLLDFVCVTVSTENVLGVSYNKPTVLTTLSEIKDVLNKLYEAGISKIDVRLIGYTSSGFEHGIYDEFSLYGKVGTREELNELSQLVEKMGGKLYLDADFQTVYSNRMLDGFSERVDTSYDLSKKLVTLCKRNIVSREKDADGAAYLISPSKYKATAESFARSVSSLTSVGMAYINAGSVLTSDYSKSRYTDRVSAAKEISASLALADKSIMVGGGNLYALASADIASDVSFYSSEFDSQKETVPFWQLVMNGSLDYCGTAYNISDNREKLFLKTVETGAVLHFSFFGEGDDILLENGLYDFDANSVIGRIDEVISLSKRVADIKESSGDERIIDHYSLAEGVYKTVYSNGYTIVNYNDSEYKENGVTVEAHGSYAVFSGEEV